jgi:protein involved in polysaccharide export with SLBB domain
MLLVMTGIMAKDTGNPNKGKTDRKVQAGALLPVLFRSPPRFACLSLFLFSLLGCIGGRNHMDQALLADRGTADRNQGVAENYTLGFPDVVEVVVAGRPDVIGQQAIGPDGRINLAAAGPVRVEGQTPLEAAAFVAGKLGVPAGKVRLRVAQFKSKLVYLSGEGTGVPRAVPYRGQETVLDLLQRVGGVTPAAAPGNVYVVRSHVADGERPEVFHVDLQAIVVKKDQHTNLRLQPFDQVYVGESRQGKLNKCLPPCLRPLYQAIWGIAPRKGAGSPGVGPPMRGNP